MRVSAASSSPEPLVASVLATNGPGLNSCRAFKLSLKMECRKQLSQLGYWAQRQFSGNVALMELSLNIPILFSNKIQPFGLPAELLATQHHSSTSPRIITELYTQNDSCICIFVLAYVAIPFFYTMAYIIYFLLKHGFHLW
jgi:hypothetical protein